MANLTPGFKRTKSDLAFYIEPDLRSALTGHASSLISIGFRIVYRVVVRYSRGASANPIILAKQVREAFMNIFGLDDKYFAIGTPKMVSNPDEYSSVFWNIYWDKGPLDLRKIHRCDVALNSIAKRNQVTMEHISTTVMARELSYLKNVDMH